MGSGWTVLCIWRPDEAATDDGDSGCEGWKVDVNCEELSEAPRNDVEGDTASVSEL